MTPEECKLLAETNRGTPMGELLRRYWMPGLLSCELEADGAPVRVEMLGEKLIAFRDSKGRVGLLREFCAHRGASPRSGRRAGYFPCGLEGGLLRLPRRAAARLRWRSLRRHLHGARRDRSQAA